MQVSAAESSGSTAGPAVIELALVLHRETLDVRSRAMHTKMRLLEAKVRVCVLDLDHEAAVCMLP
jgi:hypothetical protein